MKARKNSQPVWIKTHEGIVQAESIPEMAEFLLAGKGSLHAYLCAARKTGASFFHYKSWDVNLGRYGEEYLPPAPTRGDAFRGTTEPLLAGLCTHRLGPWNGETV